MTDGRNLALDGVRGLAALSVALGHCMLIVAGMEVWSKTAFDFPNMPAQEIAGRLMHLLFPGNGAVMVFFVLSGYVLWGSFARKQSTIADTPDYLVARVFRLLPLVIATHAAATGWSRFPTPGELVANMVLLSTSMNKRAVVAAGRDDRQPGDLHRVAFVAQRSAEALRRAVRGRGGSAVLPRQSVRGLSAGLPARRADPSCSGAGVAKPRAADRRARGAAAAEHRLFLSRRDAAARNRSPRPRSSAASRCSARRCSKQRRSGSSARSATRSM